MRSLQPIEGRERVLAEREQEIDPQGTVDECRQGRVEAVVVAVVREVLLCLVEDQVHVALGLGVRRDVDERSRLGVGCFRDRPCERLLRSFRPAGEDDDQRLLRERTQRAATLASRSDDLPTPLGP